MLYEKLEAYSKSDWYPFHMPGHKRNPDGRLPAGLPYSMDITEITGFDDLHHAGGILKEAMEQAAELYGADATYFLVNGSTCGIQSAISGAANPGDIVITAANCHKSVHNTIFLRQMEEVVVTPTWREDVGIYGAILPEQIKEALEANPKAACVVIVSPTYDGIVSPIGEIAKVCHQYGVPLVVDEAHGAHFRYHAYFPVSAVEQGADAVIQSVHKTLPALTQTALLHCNGNRIPRERIQQFLRIYESSSPSYVLLSSIENCILWLEEHGRDAFADYVDRLEGFYEAAAKLKHLYVPYDGNQDRSKILISLRRYNQEHGTTISGMWLKEQLGNHRLEMEMAGKDYVVALTSCMDTDEGFRRLAEALFTIDAKLDKPYEGGYDKWKDSQGEVAMQIAEILTHIGKPAEADYYVYPPGIILAARGEMITSKKADQLISYAKQGLKIQGLD